MGVAGIKLKTKMIVYGTYMFLMKAKPSNNQKYSIPSTNAKEITWSSSNEKYPLLYKWSNGKTYKCDGTPDYCKVTNVNGKTVFKYKGSWDKTKNEDDCVWDIYVSYEGKTISLNDFVKQKEAKEVKTKKEQGDVRKMKRIRQRRMRQKLLIIKNIQ